MRKILIVEDDILLNRTLGYNLSKKSPRLCGNVAALYAKNVLT